MTAPLDLGAWIRALARAGELATVEVEVDAELEVAEIHRRVIAAGGPALLFPRVRGSPFPLVTNLFGTRARVRRAFGERPEELVAALARLPRELLPPSLGRLWRQRGLLAALARVGGRRRAGDPVRAIVESPPRLSHLPATKSWPRDGGRYFTLPLVYTEHPDTGVSNLGIYRLQLFDDATTGWHAQIGKGGGFHLAAAEAHGRPLPVNVHLGGPPALVLAALAPLPENVPELLLASLVLGGKLPLVRNPAGPLPLIGGTEIVLVGEVAPGVRRPEGPFGDHYGYYSEIHDYPVFTCRAVLRREGAVFPATVVGKPRQEDFYLGDYVQELLAPVLPLAMPAVRSLWSYGETGYHALAAAVVHERYEREAMASAFRILGEGQLSLTKFLLVTDRPVDLRDFRATLTHILARADFRTGFFLFPNLAMDSLDYAGPRIHTGSKGVLLGLGDPVRALPDSFTGTPRSGVAGVAVFSPGCLVVQGPAHAADPAAAGRIAADPAFAAWPLLVLTDDAARAARSVTNFLWTTFTRFDPAADVHAAATSVAGNQLLRRPPILIDVRRKAGYPAELFCDPETAAKVDRRWREYFPAGMEAGDSDRGHLD
ncbi:MAG: UbiD family decarboxylase [Planctomycetota bacterium]